MREKVDGAIGDDEFVELLLVVYDLVQVFLVLDQVSLVGEESIGESHQRYVDRNAQKNEDDIVENVVDQVQGGK